MLMASLGFTTEFARTPIACGAPAAEAFPEERPRGFTREEAEYVETTGNYAAVEEYRAEVVEFLEAKACGRTARQRVLQYGVGTLAGWTLGAMALKAAFKRKPKSPNLPKPPQVATRA